MTGEHTARAARDARRDDMRLALASAAAGNVRHHCARCGRVAELAERLMLGALSLADVCDHRLTRRQRRRLTRVIGAALLPDGCGR